MEVLQTAGVVHPPSVSVRDGVLCSTALCWIYDLIQQKGGKHIEELTEQVDYSYYVAFVPAYF